VSNVHHAQRGCTLIRQLHLALRAFKDSSALLALGSVGCATAANISTKQCKVRVFAVLLVSSLPLMEARIVPAVQLVSLRQVKGRATA
jgi:hypothetical protein